MITRLKERSPHWRRLIIIPVIAVGILLTLVLVKTRRVAGKKVVAERVTSVRTVEALSMAIVPRAIGYGYIQPDQVWDAVAEVPGKVVEVHPDFKRGAILAAGEILVRIDPAESGYVREQSEAEIRRFQALISKLDQSEKDTRRQLEVEQGRLKLAGKELERNQRLVSQGVISQSELDTQEKSYLAQRNAVQNFQSILNSLPAERASLQAQLASARSRTAGARLDEERTVIRTPFDCRLSATRVELGQAVSMNQVVAQLDSLDEHEASVQVPLHAFRNLLPDGLMPAGDGGVRMTAVRRFLGMDAVIRVRTSGADMEWIGHLARISDSVDTSTRTVGVFVAIDNAIMRPQDDKRVPLMKNMYAEVELLGKPTRPYIVVPRNAVNEGVVNVLGADDRLERRTVSVAFVQSSFAAVESGLEPGEQVVVSELVPAIQGMLLDATLDERLQRRLADEATARVAVK